MRRLALTLTLASLLGGCQLLTNFVRPLADEPDAEILDGGDAVDDAGVLDEG